MLIAPLDECAALDRALIGGKALNLGRLLQIGLNVPQGFCITTVAAEVFTSHNGIDVHGEPELVRAAVREGQWPPELVTKVSGAFNQLRASGTARVICRSSGAAEDGNLHSFAGQFESVVNPETLEDLLHAIKRCWSSAFADGILQYAQQHALQGASMGVIVQEMVASSAAGVAFGVDPLTGANTVIVEASWGLGEPLVQGQLTPDRYTYDPATKECVLQRVGSKEFFLRRAPRVHGVYAGDMTVMRDPWQRCEIPTAIVLVDRVDRQYYAQTPRSHRSTPALPLHVAKQIACTTHELSSSLGGPQDVEFAITPDGAVRFVQARPATAIPSDGTSSLAEPEARTSQGVQLLRQYTADEVQVVSPGRAAGRAVLVSGVQNLDLVREGDVLVTLTTTPEYVPAMIRCSAIVSGDGGMLSHTAIVSRELQKPCLSLSDDPMVIPAGSWVEIDTRAQLLNVWESSGGAAATEKPEMHEGASPEQRAARAKLEAAERLGMQANRVLSAQHLYPLHPDAIKPGVDAYLVSIDDLLLEVEADGEKGGVLRNVPLCFELIRRTNPNSRCFLRTRSCLPTNPREPWNETSVLTSTAKDLVDKILHRAEAAGIDLLPLHDADEVAAAETHAHAWRNITELSNTDPVEGAAAPPGVRTRALVFTHPGGWRSLVIEDSRART